MHPTIAQATLVIVCYACCGDPKLRPLCKRCTGTGAEPTTCEVNAELAARLPSAH